MVGKRGQLLDKLLEKIGVKRANPGNPYMNKTELSHLNSWIDVAKDKLKQMDTDTGKG